MLGLSGMGTASVAAAGGASTGAKVAGLVGAVSPLGWVSTGLSLLGSGMFGGGTKVSSSSAESGRGLYFAPANSVVYNKPLLDLENPVHLLVVGVAAIGAAWAYKRYKKG